MADPRITDILRTIGFGAAEELGPVSTASAVLKRGRKRPYTPDSPSAVLNFASDEALEASLRDWLLAEGHDEAAAEALLSEFFRSARLDRRGT